MTAIIIAPTVVTIEEYKPSRYQEGARFGLRGTAWGTVLTVTIKNGRSPLSRWIPWRYGRKIGRFVLGASLLDIELLLRVRSPNFVEFDSRFVSPRFGVRELVLEEWDRKHVDRWIYEQIAGIPPGSWDEIIHAMASIFWVYIPDDTQLIDEPAPEGFEY